MHDFDACLQVAATAEGTRLFSSSLTPRDADNFLAHSCDPNCGFVIGPELAAALVARRGIAPGEAVTFDYDETEDDLRGSRGAFECACGSKSCRRIVLGKLFSPPPPLGSPRLDPRQQPSRLPKVTPGQPAVKPAVKQAEPEAEALAEAEAAPVGTELLAFPASPPP